MPSLVKEQFDKDLEVIAKGTNKNEKLAWARKRKKLDEIISGKLQPIQDKILELHREKQTVLDEVAELREIMVSDCVHPPEYLVHHGVVIECKFCLKKITINTHSL